MSSENKTKENYQTWLNVSQSGEFDYHRNNEWRQSDAFMNQTNTLFSHFGFSPNQFKNKIVIDLGAGSRLRTMYFEGANIIAIEPLAQKFLDTIQWSDLNKAYRVYSEPAEKLIEDCISSADLLISINVLDHCYDFETIVSNISQYLKDDGIAFLSFDKHLKADEMHPLSLNEEICEAAFKKYSLKIQNQSKGFGGALKEDTYGHGPYCLNYWLKK